MMTVALGFVDVYCFSVEFPSSDDDLGLRVSETAPDLSALTGK